MEWLQNFSKDDLEVRVSELLVATADDTDFLVEPAVQEVLSLVRKRLQMDVIFVAEFTEGQHVFRAVDRSPTAPQLAVGMSSPLEESWCQRVVDGRLPALIPDSLVFQTRGDAPTPPFPIGTYLTAPIVLTSGKVYGTLCCFSQAASPQATEKSMQTLRYTAKLTASKIERSGHGRTSVGPNEAAPS